MQAVVAQAIRGGVEQVCDRGGRGEGVEEVDEEGRVIAAAGFEEEFARRGALGVRGG